MICSTELLVAIDLCDAFNMDGMLERDAMKVWCKRHEKQRKKEKTHPLSNGGHDVQSVVGNHPRIKLVQCTRVVAGKLTKQNDARLRVRMWMAMPRGTFFQMCAWVCKSISRQDTTSHSLQALSNRSHTYEKRKKTDLTLRHIAKKVPRQYIRQQNAPIPRPSPNTYHAQRGADETCKDHCNLNPQLPFA